MRMELQAKRLTYLMHRWTGVAGCVLMALWFFSGVVMLYVGYPKLTPWERLGALPALPSAPCCAPLDAVLDGRAASAADLVLTSVAGELRYVLRDKQGGLQVRSAEGERLAQPVTLQAALAEAGVFAAAEPASHATLVHEDRWTHARALDAHRPLYRVQVGGSSPGLLYVSSVTGQTVMDAPLHQQRWNYVGAWLHWLYMFRDRSVDPVWSWLVIVLSAACTLTAVSGVTVGLWRWRFRGRYKSGARTPYQEGWMRWHHMMGLIFSAFVCTWIFSGLMSMNPGGIFSPAHDRPNLAAYQGSPGQTGAALAQPGRIMIALHEAGFRPVELQWRRLGLEEYVLAYDAQARTRVVRLVADTESLFVTAAWQAEEILEAAQQLFAAPLVQSQVQEHYDAYYYQRHPEAMNGARSLGLPALRLDYADKGATRAYIDMRTGELGISLDRSQRVGRWLFYFLHSWDTPSLLGAGQVRELAIVFLSLGGLLISLSGIVIGWRRLRKSMSW